jgi:hypothetical protein
MVPARRSGSISPREANQPAAARSKRTFSSAPQVRARATSSAAGLVCRAIVPATVASAPVGRIVTGKVGPRRRRLDRILSAVRMGPMDRLRQLPTLRRPPGSLFRHNPDFHICVVHPFRSLSPRRTTGRWMLVAEKGAHPAARALTPMCGRRTALARSRRILDSFPPGS